MIIISLIVSLCIQGVALVATFCKSIWNRLMVVPLVLALGTTTFGAVKDSVVMVGDCSGVCVDPCGLVLSAKHCEHPPVVLVRFQDRTVTARRIYVAPETEGPVLFDCDGDGFPAVRVAEKPPHVGESVWSYGYPTTEGQRELRWIRGQLLGCRTFEYQGGTFKGNVTTFPTRPGWSGGPLFTANSEVCGLLNSSDSQTSVFISSAVTRLAFEVGKQRVTTESSLYVFGSPTCGPCQKFKRDYAEHTVLKQRLNARFVVTYVDIDAYPNAAEQFGIKQVPAFLVPGQPVFTGYDQPEELLRQLGIDADKIEAPPAVLPPPPVEKPKAPQPSEPATDKAAPKPDRRLGDKIDAAAGVAQTAITVATWLGITGATGGTGGLILGGIALWRTLRRRKESITARDPPAPTVITVDSPPPPQAIVPETRFAPYERDTFAEAFAWAEAELVRKYPGSVSTLEAMKGLIDQFLSGKGIKRPN